MRTNDFGDGGARRTERVRSEGEENEKKTIGNKEESRWRRRSPGEEGEGRLPPPPQAEKQDGCGFSKLL
ncbi:hypothetical protein RHMOL_Rhmol05G0063400 [Rhododendron molle]|uniref:Uncharacterized protein n=1 Tax=Rhododendron molle TaxID=49168 RepID=A0ACC0NL74_RHOML|nr:hypothetical protein RHMOL_Rhmol05G0063400 [Rhododendron molle]